MEETAASGSSRRPSFLSVWMNMWGRVPSVPRALLLNTQRYLVGLGLGHIVKSAHHSTAGRRSGEQPHIHPSRIAAAVY